MRGLGWLALLSASVACSVYSASDLDVPSDGGIGGGATGGDLATSGAGVGGGGNGGLPATGATSGSGNAAGDSGSGGTNTEGTSSEGGVTGDGGEAPGSGPDECPNDPAKRLPGVCGCGIPDVSNTELSDCQSLKVALTHRYDFEGTGSAVRDRVGTSDGVVVDAELSQVDGRGVVSLTGGSRGPYVDLPNGLVSSLTSVTVETWLTWRGGAAWQRIFDFGDSTAAIPEDSPALGKTYLFATPRSDTDVALASYSNEGNASGQQLEATASEPLPMTLSQVVVIANGATRKLALYVNGSKVSEQGWTGDLSKINDVNVWLGRSQYAQDPELNAVLHDFRIYGAALSDAQVATAFLAGPDPDFFVEDAAAASALR